MSRHQSDADELFSTAMAHREATGHNRFRLALGDYVQEVFCAECEARLLSAAWHSRDPWTRTFALTP